MLVGPDEEVPAAQVEHGGVDDRGDARGVAHLLRRIGQRLAADQVEDGVDRLAELRADRAGRVVEHLGGAGVADEAVVLRARRPDDVGAEGGGDLHREEADPAGRAGHQHPVALTDVEHLGQRLVGGEPGQRQCPGLGEGERLRLVPEAALRHGHELGRRPPLDVVAADVAEHLVADGEVDHRRAHLLHDAAEVPARADGEVVRIGAGEVALPDRQVDGVHPGGMGPDQDDVGPYGRLGKVVADLQDRLVAEPVVGGALHRRPFTYRPKAFWISRRESRSARSCRLS